MGGHSGVVPPSIQRGAQLVLEEARARRDGRVLLWHRLVHEHYNEDLHYFLLKFPSFRKETLDEFGQRLRERLGITGFCLYPVLGRVDSLLRVWLNPVSLKRLENQLREMSVSEEHFAVREMAHWAFDSTATESLRLEQLIGKYTPRDFAAVQQGGERRLRHRMEKEGLLAYRPISFRNKVKFYTIATYPFFETDYVEMIRQEVAQTIKKYEGSISLVSLYDTGKGVLIKACLPTAFAVGEFALELRSNVARFKSFTETLVIAARSPQESDDLSGNSLTRQHVMDPDIKAFCPEFYELALGPDLRRRFEAYLHRADMFRGFSDAHRARLSKVVLAVARELSGDSDHAITCFDILSSWFPSRENRLRDLNSLMLAALADGDNNGRQQRLAGRLGIKRDRYKAIGQLIDEAILLLQEAERQGKSSHRIDSLGRNALNVGASLRNAVEHGEFRVPAEWEGLIDSVAAFMKVFSSITGEFDRIIRLWKDGSPITRGTRGR